MGFRGGCHACMAHLILLEYFLEDTFNKCSEKHQ